MFYSIFDNDIGRYLEGAKNCKSKRESLEKYVIYRGEEYWGEKMPKDLISAIKNEPDERIMQDMALCNFELIIHNEKE